MTDQRVALRQRRDLGQLIEAAATLYLQNAAPLVIIAAVVVPLGLASAIFQTTIKDDVTAAVVVAVLGLAQLIVSLLAGAALIAAIGEIDSGRKADFSQAYDAAFARFWTLAGALLRVFVIVLLLFITVVGIPWAIRQAVRWIFVQQAIILEGANVDAALRSSSEAVIGSWWRTLGISIVIAVIGSVPAVIAGALFRLAPVLVSGTVNAAVNAALLPFFVIATTMLYFDLKARKETASSTAEPSPPSLEGTSNDDA